MGIDKAQQYLIEQGFNNLVLNEHSGHLYKYASDVMLDFSEKLRKENEELRAKVCEYETAFDGIDDLQSKFDQANEKIKKLEEQLAESFATKFKIQEDKIKEQELVIESMREALKSIVDMPNYDQDNEHRLRYIAEQTLKEVNNGN